MKLTASEMVTLDGVYQGPGGPDEDRSGGFDRGGWTAPFADAEGWRILTTWFERADAFLLGRKTFEIWEPYWPQHDGGDPVHHLPGSGGGGGGEQGEQGESVGHGVTEARALSSIWMRARSRNAFT